MKFVIAFILFLGFQLMIAQQSDAGMLYTGTFKKGNFVTDIEFDIRLKEDSYTISFNSLEQNAFGIPAGDISISGDSINFALQSDYYRYAFTCTPFGADLMDGILTVDGKTYDFKLNKVAPRTKSTPNTKDIRFRSEGLLLYGTIYYPEKPNGKAIYLVTSSGNQDRSGSRAEAMLFAKAGYISFHIDKRGTGISDGNWELADIPELCKDDLHALEFLHQSEKIDYAHIGIKGNSQGATKVPYILQNEPKLAFGIVVSCPASTLLESDLNYWRNRNIESIGIEDIEIAMNLQNTVFQYIAGNIPKQSLEDEVKRNLGQDWFNKVWVPELDHVDFDSKLNYSPLPYFKNNTSAMLIIQGTNDEIINLNSLDLIKDSIGKNGNRKNKFIALKNANHAMMMVEDSDFKYWQSLHSNYMPTMLKWIRKL